MFIVSEPSTWASSMPDWLGGVQRIAAKSEDALIGAGAAVYGVIANSNPFAPLADPVGKAVNKIGDETASLLKTTTAGISSAAGGFSTGLKWAGFLIVAGIAFYILAVVGPFLPKPEQK